ncbi:unnamed protein product, partial [Oikopleura dioica]
SSISLETSTDLSLLGSRTPTRPVENADRVSSVPLGGSAGFRTVHVPADVEFHGLGEARRPVVDHLALDHRLPLGHVSLGGRDRLGAGVERSDQAGASFLRGPVQGAGEVTGPVAAEFEERVEAERDPGDDVQSGIHVPGGGGARGGSGVGVEPRVGRRVHRPIGGHGGVVPDRDVNASGPEIDPPLAQHRQVDRREQLAEVRSEAGIVVRSEAVQGTEQRGIGAAVELGAGAPGPVGRVEGPFHDPRRAV